MKLQRENNSQKLLKSYLILVSVQKATGLFWKVFNRIRRFLVFLLSFHENKFITDYIEKTGLFNSLFANHRWQIESTSVLPTNCENITDKSSSNITFTDDDIGKIFKGSDINKTLGHDMISISLIKLYRGSN